MKKFLSIISILVLTAVFATGCSARPSTDAPRTESDSAQSDAGVSQPAPGSTAQNNTDTSNLIGEEKAKEIALQKAGLTAEDADFVRVELDRDDGVWKYEIEFRNGTTEYDIDIKADDGEILSWDVDNGD